MIILCISTSDFLVSVLSILVTVLLGWNVFNAINFHNEKKSLIQEMNNFKSKMKYNDSIIRVAGANKAIELIRQINKSNNHFDVDQYPDDEDNYYIVVEYMKGESTYPVKNRFKVDIINNKILKYDPIKNEYEQL